MSGTSPGPCTPARLSPVHLAAIALARKSLTMTPEAVAAIAVDGPAVRDYMATVVQSLLAVIDEPTGGES